MKKVAPKDTSLNGLDVSHYDEVIDFEAVKASGRSFCFAKATEYTEDVTYKRNKAGAEAAGLIFGAYHFFHPRRDAKAQAENFLASAKLQSGNMPAVLDWESTDDVPCEADRAQAKIWLDKVEAATGKPPIIYGSPYFLEALSLDDEFKKYPLWVAHYGVLNPLIPSLWDTWTFWQHTDRGDVKGIPAPDEDLDLFNGSLEDLLSITIS